ncbi:MAG: colanic acid biosynthesis glycosyltransferase WcaL [Acaryochloris sp. RU_4_1]|nr:colanic acid biosynthesis glycosyltransferase WcaL [Acaryochloris sp. RU_4_1]
MNIACLVGDFPSVSETFILSQITNILEQNHLIDIYATQPQNPTAIHPDIDKYQLLNHTYYYPSIPRNYFLRIGKALILFVSSLFQDPVLAIRALNFFRHGKQALSLRLFYAIIPFLRKRPTYDVIHCHFGHLGILGMQLKEIGAIQGKLYTTFHAWDITEYLQEAGNNAYQKLFMQGDRFLPISEHWKNRLIELGCSSHKVTVHRMGIDCNKFLFIARQPPLEGQVRITTVARLIEKKGIEYGIRAIAKLQQQYPNLKYRIIGEGDLRDRLEHFMSELEVENRVELLGWKAQNEVIEILNQSHLLLAPSVTGRKGDQEGIPVAIMEAMAMGLPVISTQHSGIPELVEDGVSGFLVPERDADAIAEKLAALMENPDLCLRMGKAGRSCVETHYSIKQLTQQLIDIYHQS